MFESNASYGAGDLLSEIQAQIESAGGPTTAFTLLMQKQAIEDRIRFKQWLNQSNMLSEQTLTENARASQAVNLSRRAQHVLNSF